MMMMTFITRSQHETKPFHTITLKPLLIKRTSFAMRRGRDERESVASPSGPKRLRQREAMVTSVTIAEIDSELRELLHSIDVPGGQAALLGRAC